MDTEQQLLERILRSEREAQQELYHRYAGSAIAVAMRYIPDREAARDVVQEAFAKIFAGIAKYNYQGEGSLRSWVMRVVSNEAFNWVRKESHFAFADFPEDETPDEEPDVGDIDLEVLQRMIEQLPEGCRVVLNLYVFEQKSHKEIARLLHIKESSSASQYLRAKRMLAKSINEYKRKHQL